MSAQNSLLINVQAPLYEKDGVLYLESQACNGLRLWARNFDHVTAMIPLRTGPPPPSWIPLQFGIGDQAGKLTIETLPWAYRPDHFLQTFFVTRRRIAKLIRSARYLRFSVGTCLFGDWGAVACRRAYNMNRAYAVWTDRVESAVVRQSIGSGPWRKSLQARIYHRPMAALEKLVVQRAKLGLFHGKDTFESYAPYCENPHVVHNVHISKNDHIQSSELEKKVSEAATGVLRIVYVGRIDLMKGPYDWIAVTKALTQAKIDFEAVWLGDGTEQASARDQVRKLGLEDRVHFPGFAADRTAVLDALRHAHIMLFCHKTPESPRCLIEALASGCPIVGYDSAYPRDLIQSHGGGVLTPLNDVNTLAEAVTALAHDRARLATLIKLAACDGAMFDDVSVFKHRSDLIKEYL